LENLWYVHISIQSRRSAGDEKRQAGLGTSFSGRHLHFLLASPAALNASALEYSWKSLYGGNIGIDTSNGISIANVGHALVQAYNPAHENQLNEYGKPMGGIAYILKMHGDSQCELAFSRNLSTFYPQGNAKQANSRTRRALRRANPF
jgi:hypothetical protein